MIKIKVHMIFFMILANSLRIFLFLLMIYIRNHLNIKIADK
jgi:hypothetical protein